MGRPDEGRRSELDALLASRTPSPESAVSGESRSSHDEVGGADGVGVGADGGGGVDGPGDRPRTSSPVRGRLEAWLRGGRHDEAVEAGEAVEADVESDGGRQVPSEPDEVDGRIGVPESEGGDGVDRRGAGPNDRSGGVSAVDDLGELRLLPVGLIVPNRYQPRRRFDDAALTSLTESIRELGVLQPVLVRPLDDERFELVAGERRWRASQRAGLHEIPALVRGSSDQSALERAIVENLHRQDLSPLEEAAAYQELVVDFGLTQEAVAKRVGKSRSAVTNTLRLLQLPVSVQRLVADGEVSAGHARALLSVSDPEAQAALAARVVDEEWSVRRTEEAARSWATRQSSGSPASARDERSTSQTSAAELEVRALLEDRLATQVEVTGGAGSGGRLVIRFADGEDLDRLVQAILQGRPGAD